MPSRLYRFDIVELDELRSYLNEFKFDLMRTIDFALSAENPPSVEWCYEHVKQYSCNFNRLLYLISIVQNRIIELKGIQLFENEIFSNIESENFFKFAVKTWISKHSFKNRAISYLFYMMWDKSNPIDRLSIVVYDIVGSRTKFAQYWNRLYSNIYTFESVKQPNLKSLTEITSNKYKLQLTNVIKEFKKGN